MQVTMTMPGMIVIMNIFTFLHVEVSQHHVMIMHCNHEYLSVLIAPPTAAVALSALSVHLTQMHIHYKYEGKFYEYSHMSMFNLLLEYN